MTPQKLYKYYRTNSFLFGLFKDKQLFCCDRRNLNDPHDGLYVFSDSLRQQWAENVIPYVRELLASNEIYNNMPNQLITYSANRQLTDKAFYDLLHENGATLNVCSFTERPDNELMWAHYADNFKGVCLEFNFSDVPEINNVLSKVEYTNETPIINSMSYEELKRVMTIKRKAWEYESEWRLLLNDIVKVRFDPMNLKTVFFGTRTPKEVRTEIINLCKTNDLEHVDFQEIRVDLNGIRFE